MSSACVKNSKTPSQLCTTSPDELAARQLRGLGSDPFADPGRQNKWLKDSAFRILTCSRDRCHTQPELNPWCKDISTSTKNYFKKVLAPLQKPIVQEYQVLTILDQYANYTMDKACNTGFAAAVAGFAVKVCCPSTCSIILTVYKGYMLFCGALQVQEMPIKMI